MGVYFLFVFHILSFSEHSPYKQHLEDTTFVSVLKICFSLVSFSLAGGNKAQTWHWYQSSHLSLGKTEAYLLKYQTVPFLLFIKPKTKWPSRQQALIKCSLSFPSQTDLFHNFSVQLRREMWGSRVRTKLINHVSEVYVDCILHINYSLIFLLIHGEEDTKNRNSWQK